MVLQKMDWKNVDHGLEWGETVDVITYMECNSDTAYSLVKESDFSLIAAAMVYFSVRKYLIPLWHSTLVCSVYVSSSLFPRINISNIRTQCGLIK